MAAGDAGSVSAQWWKLFSATPRLGTTTPEPNLPGNQIIVLEPRSSIFLVLTRFLISVLYVTS
jgi:hypothetical protein